MPEQQHQSKLFKEGQQIDNKASPFLGTPLKHLKMILQRRILLKIKNILNKPKNPLQKTVKHKVSTLKGFFGACASQSATEDPQLST